MTRYLPVRRSNGRGRQAIFVLAFAAVVAGELACSGETGAVGEPAAIGQFMQHRDLLHEAARRYGELRGANKLEFDGDDVLWNGTRLSLDTARRDGAQVLSDDELFWWAQFGRASGVIVIATGNVLPARARTRGVGEYERFFVSNVDSHPRGFIHAAPDGYAHGYFVGDASRSVPPPVPSAFGKLVEVEPGWFYFEETTADERAKKLLDHSGTGHPRPEKTER